MTDRFDVPIYTSDGGYRLDETVVIIVNGVRYALPLGHQTGKGDREFYENAVHGDGYSTTGLYGLQFWMPSLRYPERLGTWYQRHCEAGRVSPGPDEYTIAADVQPPGTPSADKKRAERLLSLERTEDALGATLEDVLAGRVPEHSDRLVADVPGAIVYDGLFWGGAPPEVGHAQANSGAGSR